MANPKDDPKVQALIAKAEAAGAKAVEKAEAAATKAVAAATKDATKAAVEAATGAFDNAIAEVDDKAVVKLLTATKKSVLAAIKA